MTYSDEQLDAVGRALYENWLGPNLLTDIPWDEREPGFRKVFLDEAQVALDAIDFGLWDAA